MAKPRVGVIGAGSWTVSSHLPNLVRRRDPGDIEFAIVNRRNATVLCRIKEEFGFPAATTDWREVIAEEPESWSSPARPVSTTSRPRPPSRPAPT